ncbi:MAG: amidohydrolase family protein [Rhodoferax sp.]
MSLQRRNPAKTTRIAPNRRQFGVWAMGAGAAVLGGCASPPPPPPPAQPTVRTSAFPTPEGACDCHHVAQLSQEDALDASPDAYRTMQQRLGLQRQVLIQPAATPFTQLLRVLTTLDTANTRAVLALPDVLQQRQLQPLHQAGVRGVYLDMVNGGDPEAALAFAPRLRELGWHIEVDATPTQWADTTTLWTRLPVPLVFDHMGRLHGAPLNHPALHLLRDRLGVGKAFVKLTGLDDLSRVGQPDFSDSIRLAELLTREAPNRTLWGSGWTSGHDQPDDAVRRIDLLAEAVPNAATRKRVLVDNPARLYGFAQANFKKNPVLDLTRLRKELFF